MNIWQSLLIVFFIAVLFAILILWVLSRRVLKQKAESWPICMAKIENVYLDYLPREVRSRRLRDYGTQKSNVALAYSYSVGDSYYSGKIRLAADEPNTAKIEKELVGSQIDIRYNPSKAEESVFLEGAIKSWPVVEDSRVSPLSWLANYLDY